MSLEEWRAELEAPIMTADVSKMPVPWSAEDEMADFHALQGM